MSMVNRGSSLGVTAGFLGMAAAAATLYTDYMMSMFDSMPTVTVDNSIGWLEALLSIFVIGFAQSSRNDPRHAGALLIAVAIIGTLVGDGYSAACMLLATIGGIFCVTGADDRSSPPGNDQDRTCNESRLGATPCPEKGITPRIGLLAAIAALFITPFCEQDSDRAPPP